MVLVRPRNSHLASGLVHQCLMANIWLDGTATIDGLLGDMEGLCADALGSSDGIGKSTLVLMGLIGWANDCAKPTV